MTHLTDEEIGSAARAGRLPTTARDHLAGCQHCQDAVSAWRHLARAARTADRALTGPLRVPDFDVLLGAAVRTPAHLAAGGTRAVPATADTPALPAAGTAGAVPAAASGPALPVAAARPAAPAAAAGPALARAMRLAVAVTAAQAKLLPRVLAPLTAAGFGVALAAAAGAPTPAWVAPLFGALVTLVMLIGVTATCLPGRDPRQELLFSMPVSPGAVFLARLTLVLSLDVLAAATTSVLAGGVLHRATVADLVLAWLGPSLLSAGLALVVAVAVSPWAGLAAGTLLWALGSVSTLPRTGRVDVGVGAIAARIWTTDWWTVGVALTLIGLAVAAAFRPAGGRPPAGESAAP